MSADLYVNLSISLSKYYENPPTDYSQNLTYILGQEFFFGKIYNYNVDSSWGLIPYYANAPFNVAVNPVGESAYSFTPNGYATYYFLTASVADYTFDLSQITPPSYYDETGTQVNGSPYEFRFNQNV